MKIYREIEKYIFLIAFIIVIAYPLVMYSVGVENNLTGSYEKEELSFENLDNYILQNFPGKEFIVRLKNQLFYSLFNMSTNESFTITSDKTKFAIESLAYYYHGNRSVDEEVVDKLITKLRKFDSICKRKNKKMMIILTPTKARYYHGELPMADDILLLYEDKNNKLPYDLFVEKLKETNLYFFDSIDYINKHKELLKGPAPLFYKSSHHWSTVMGNMVGLGVQDYIRKNLGIKVSKVKITASPSDVITYPDADLHNVLNIIEKPKEQFYDSVFEYEQIEYDNLSYTIQGGSFLGELLFPQTTITLNGETFHIENKVMLYKNYTDNISFTSYDDLDKKVDLINHIKNTDLFVFEIHELNVSDATFGFLDYLLANARYM